MNKFAKIKIIYKYLNNKFKIFNKKYNKLKAKNIQMEY